MPEFIPGLTQAIAVLLFLIKAFAFIDCLRRNPADFEARQTLDKRAWLLILGLAMVAQLLLGSLNLLNLIGTVAALVYLAQLRSPAS